LDYVHSLNYKVVGWNLDSCDWAFEDGFISAQENTTCQARADEMTDFEAYVLHRTAQGRGGIMLMHDVTHTTAHHLENLIIRWQALNYRFVQLDDTVVFPNLNAHSPD
jgi:peptidoglycan/xylan/chitin deacetylase (PgdA/CDA1 family)